MRGCISRGITKHSQHVTMHIFLDLKMFIDDVGDTVRNAILSIVQNNKFLYIYSLKSYLELSYNNSTASTTRLTNVYYYY